MRRCVGCRVSKEKSTLLRIVASGNGKGETDPLYRKEGRGAYICRDLKCLEKARKSGGFARSLRINADDDLYEAIRKEL